MEGEVLAKGFLYDPIPSDRDQFTKGGMRPDWGAGSSPGWCKNKDTHFLEEGGTGSGAGLAKGRKDVGGARRLISAKLQTPIDSPIGSGEWEWIAPFMEGEMLAKGSLYDPMSSYGDPSMNGGRRPDGGAESSPCWRSEPLRGWIVGGNQWVSAIWRAPSMEGEVLAKGFLYDPIPSDGDQFTKGGMRPDWGAGSSPGWRPEPLRG